MKLSILSTATALLSFSSTAAFVPSNMGSSRASFVARHVSETENMADSRTAKPIGTSFLPEEAVERAKIGSPIEKQKMAKDGTSAWIDVYEYARKIREGEMTWEEVDKADLDTVSGSLFYFCQTKLCCQLTFFSFS
jgi:hypothetical protein